MKAVTPTESRAANGLSMMLLRDFFTSFYVLRPRVQSQRTRDFYRDEISKLDRFNAKPVALSDLSERMVLAHCRAQLAAGSSFATVQKSQTAIRALWAYAAKKAADLSIAVAPVPSFERWPRYEREPVCYSVAELEQLLSVAAEQRELYGSTPASVFWPALILVCFESGCRISAVMAVRWDDYQNGKLLFRAEHAKDKADTTAHLSPLLQSYLEAMPHESPEVFGAFPYDRTRFRNNWRGLNRRFKSIIEGAGLVATKFERFHKLRKTFATHVTNARGEAIAQSMLGHSSLSVTRRYLDKSKLDLPKACEILPTIKIPTKLRIVG